MPEMGFVFSIICCLKNAKKEGFYCSPDSFAQSIPVLRIHIPTNANNWEAEGSSGLPVHTDLPQKQSFLTFCLSVYITARQY